MGGEKSAAPFSWTFVTGSPPRGRGKAEQNTEQNLTKGITPAWAGKSLTKHKVTTRSWDHPRVGGEKAAEMKAMEKAEGSPPRGRGKASRGKGGAAPFRITPAWAGKRNFCFSRCWYAWDHPRVGGEKWNCLFASASALGSPPRGRGKARVCPKSYFRLGITPAWAGKRSSMLSSSAFSRDHPRVGGEKKMPKRPLNESGGSPPRGRGKVMFVLLWFLFYRITPAWAGKRRSAPPLPPLDQDHPRVGGEKADKSMLISCTRGSPPRGRGKD